MARVEDLAERYRQHMATPWQKTVAGAQRVVMVVYEKELERTLLGRLREFEIATKETGHEWHEIHIADCFAKWIAGDEYREHYFEAPDDLQLKLETEFAEFVAARLRDVLTRNDVGENSVVGIFGVAGLFGFTRVSKVLKQVEPEIKGRLVVFFPGQLDRNNYRLLDARDGWNYLAVPITLHGSGGAQ